MTEIKIVASTHNGSTTAMVQLIGEPTEAELKALEDASQMIPDLITRQRRSEYGRIWVADTVAADYRCGERSL